MMHEDVWSDLGNRQPNSKDRYDEILARAVVLRQQAELSEQEIAAKIIANEARLQRHDRLFRDGFLSGAGELLVSRELCRQLGHIPHEVGGLPNEDDYDMGQMSPEGEA